ncbi:hypothetical protein QLS31_02265 [Flavobacterium sp. XS2P24]|uniref:hypothetical protein n=1 Tax=Flavobacterium sp. XS2P24 TaxID=3041249 RepID=UPI0024A8448A|nr:hypothetical protein [Flavobacterium sp. XS2P24]MDI6048647.1 hypothetical protein [Flavobacterium sp. XS2P24]
MKKNILVIIAILLFSCNNSEKNNNALEKENKLLKKELELEKREKQILPKEKQTAKQKFNSELNVRGNLIHCQNEKFIIRIDRMNNENLRYATWNKPKNESDEPGLIMTNGKIEKQGTMGGHIYTFENEEWTYIVEDNQMGETDESIGLFLKLLQNGNEILYTKMKEK